VLHDPDLRTALLQSLRLAAIAVLVTVPLGVALALGLTRWRGRTASASRVVSLATLVTPEIVMGTALLLVIVHVLRFIPLGTPAQAIGHITFSIAFVLIIVRGRLLAIGPEYEEAARDLGASRLQAIRLALLPMLVPAVVASAIIVALGFPTGDPIIGLVITLVIFKITWDSWRLVSTTDPGEMVENTNAY